MSFCPLGRTLVAGRRRDLNSLMVDWGEIEMGIVEPLNFTLMVMVVAFEFVVPPSISIFNVFWTIRSSMWFSWGRSMCDRVFLLAPPFLLLHPPRNRNNQPVRCWLVWSRLRWGTGESDWKINRVVINLLNLFLILNSIICRMIKA